MKKCADAGIICFDFWRKVSQESLRNRSRGKKYGEASLEAKREMKKMKLSLTTMKNSNSKQLSRTVNAGVDATAVIVE